MKYLNTNAFELSDVGMILGILDCHRWCIGCSMHWTNAASNYLCCLLILPPGALIWSAAIWRNQFVSGVTQNHVSYVFYYAFPSFTIQFKHIQFITSVRKCSLLYIHNCDDTESNFYNFRCNKIMTWGSVIPICWTRVKRICPT